MTFALQPNQTKNIKMAQSGYREMLEDYRDVDIEELMKGLTEEELLSLDEELERDVIQPNPSYSLRAPTPPPQMSDDDSSSDSECERRSSTEKKQQMVSMTHKK